MWTLVAIVLVAAWLRFAHLDTIPSCLEYDEAANVILAGEIARGESFPIFIRPYTGKEPLYFYLAAGIMCLAGVTPFALRLTSAFLGVLAVPLTCFLGRELFAREPYARRWVPLYSAALVATSYWQVHLSRFGYRAIVLPPLLALTFGALLRGLRTDRWRWIVVAGAAAGLSAYTYSSVRVLPILLLLFWAWVAIADRRRWRVRISQLMLFGLMAAVVFAPLASFFLRHPEAFSVRLEQVSVLSTAVNEGDVWGTLSRTVRLALGMFTVSGDMNPLYNAPGRPVFGPIVGTLFYVGLLVSAWRLIAPLRLTPPAVGCVRSGPKGGRLGYLLLVTWLLVMMVPNVLSARGVPHNLRAMALVPAVYVVAALGIAVTLRWLAFLGDRAVALVSRQGGRDSTGRDTVLAVPAWFGMGALILLLVWQGAATYRAYLAWARSPGPYYKGNEALVRAADLLDAHPEADPYVATYFQRHATLAVHARDYLGIRWMSNRTLILPPSDGRPAIAIYDHTNPVDPLLRERYLPPDTLLHRERGPDGEIAFEAFWVDAALRPIPAPSVPAQANLGNLLTYLGHDLNASPVSGDTLDVTLYFRVERGADRDDLTFFAHLVDDLGFRWAQETFFRYPSAQWRPGEDLIFRLLMPIAPGAPPGEYTLEVGVFSTSMDARLPLLNDAGQMIGTVVSTGPIEVAPADAPPETLPAIQTPQEVRYGDALALLGSDRDRSDLLPGQPLALTLYWQAQQPVAKGTLVSVWLSGAAGDVPLWKGHPVQGRYAFSDWPRSAFVRDRYSLRLPVDTPPGDYALQIALLDKDGIPIRSTAGVPSVSLGTIHVQATDRLWEPPPFDHHVGAQLDSAVELVGYSLDRDQVQPGGTIGLTLIWRCLERMDTDHTVFTHLLDQEGRVRGGEDNPPVHGTYPTTLWAPGEVVLDPYQIPVDADAPPGRYAIEVGMYDPVTIQRLPALDPSGETTDRILLGDIVVTDGP